MEYNPQLTGDIMKRLAGITLAVVLLASALLAAEPAADQVWSMEQTYWKYVQASDLNGYRTLWREDFLGWPSISPEPVRKAHITDWITANTSKGVTLKSYDLERLTIEVTDNLATATYRVRYTWVDKSGAGQPATIRIIHTWQRNPDGTWQILSGMSAPTNAEGH
jgi:ketosteroid isomerase-like protein